MLLIGLESSINSEILESYKGKEVIEPGHLTVLKNAESRMTEISNMLNLPANTPSEEIVTLIKGIKEGSSPTGQAILQSYLEAKERIQKIKNEMEEAGTSKDVTNRLESQSFKIANQEGQLKYLETKLNQTGLGPGMRPCWVNTDGTIDYIFDIVLTDAGIKIREHINPSRDRERSYLPMPTINPAEVLLPIDFRQRTYPLYEKSLQMECRFYVIIYDGTGPAEKETYKYLLKTVEDHFYKRLDYGPPPF